MTTPAQAETGDDPLARFPGFVRIFPLPNLVFFPRTVVPLHIFEPRYRLMLEDALRTDRFIAVTLLAPKWEEDYYGRPAVHPIACVGKVIQEETLPGGRYNIMLEGISRARIDREHAHQPYRIADVTLIEEAVLSPAEDIDWRRRFELLGTGELGHRQPHVAKAVGTLLGSTLPMSAIGDIITAGLPLEPSQKQEVLEALDIPRRLGLVLGILAALYTQDLEPPERPS